MKIRYNDNLTVIKPTIKRKQISHKLCKNIIFNTLKKHMFGYLLESPSWGDSNKCPKHMFYEDISTKHDLSYISTCSLSILYNSKFILMATS